jgi:BON domain
MKTDRDFQEEVLAALEWEPGIDAAQIGVTVRDGVVTLPGTVGTLLEKWMAERVARHLVGVRALANDLQVTPTGEFAQRLGDRRGGCKRPGLGQRGANRCREANRPERMGYDSTAQSDGSSRKWRPRRPFTDCWA